MSPVGSALLAAFGLAALSAIAALAPARWRARLVGLTTALSGTAGVVAGVAALTGHVWARSFPALLPLAGLEFAADSLSGWFLLLVGAVTVATGLYTTGYAGRDGRGPGSRPALAALALFTAAMLLVPVAASVPTLLACWELMAVTSLLLVSTEHRHADAVRAAVSWYAAMTQAGFVTLLLGLLWLGTSVGSMSFTGIRAAGAPSPVVAGGVFLLCLFGFASKAGAVPLHPWLPRAHAEAPSHVSALMSAAMVKLGVYGLLRVGFDLLGGGARWWWLTVAVLGAISALYGIVQASVATDVKRLLAYSTSENVGLILLGVGFAGLYAHSGQPVMAGLAIGAALLHTLNHAGFKTLLFTSAGAAVRATGTRNLDRLGGLVHRMPATTALFATGALMAAALPPGNGFVSEWLLLQALLHPGRGSITLTVAAPLAVAVVAVTAGVGVATFVKALGTGFLARSRSAAANSASEAPAGMRAGMALAAAGCVALAVFPATITPALARVSAALGLAAPPMRRDAFEVRLTGIGAAMWPLWLAIGVAAGITAVAVTARLAGRARRRRIAWDCGDGPLTERMEYTATSFAEPLQRVFDDVLVPEQDVDVTHARESAYHVEAVRFAQRIPDRIEHRLYAPVTAAVVRLGARARKLADGSVHRYLGYLFAALLAVLLIGAWR